VQTTIDTIDMIRDVSRKYDRDPDHSLKGGHLALTYDVKNYELTVISINATFYHVCLEVNILPLSAPVRYLKLLTKSEGTSEYR
jgi:hypothetical protein